MGCRQWQIVHSACSQPCRQCCLPLETPWRAGSEPCLVDGRLLGIWLRGKGSWPSRAARSGSAPPVRRGPVAGGAGTAHYVQPSLPDVPANGDVPNFTIKNHGPPAPRRLTGSSNLCPSSQSLLTYSSFSLLRLLLLLCPHTLYSIPFSTLCQPNLERRNHSRPLPTSITDSCVITALKKSSPSTSSTATLPRIDVAAASHPQSHLNEKKITSFPNDNDRSRAAPGPCGHRACSCPGSYGGGPHCRPCSH